jgi:hypothetical protein
VTGPIDIPTITVIAAEFEVVVGLDATTAFVLQTKEVGRMAVRVDAPAIAAIRQALDKLEVAFGSPQGRG